MTDSKKIHFGIKTAPQHTTYADILRVWQEADVIPAIEHAWLWDHFLPLGGDPTGPCLEGWTLLAALAARTERLRIGLMVTNNAARKPAVLAKIAATVDVISQGRLNIGFGAGGNELEQTAYGIELFPPKVRIQRMGEACEIIRRMWTETAPDFEGRYYQLRQAYCEPKPVQQPYPPFVIGGVGEQLTLRVVAQYADVWNFPGPPHGSVEEFKRKSQVLDGHCAAVGRDPAAVERSVQVRVDQEDPAATCAILRDFIGAGASHLVLNILPPFPHGIARWVTEKVIEPVYEAVDRQTSQAHSWQEVPHSALGVGQ